MAHRTLTRFALGLVAVYLAGCGGGLKATSLPEPTREPATENAAGECPAPRGGPVDPSSVLTPGPRAGLPASSAPGVRLILVVTILDGTCQVVPGASVDVWHTDAQGRYGPGHGTAELECCYYQGSVRTDENGRFQLNTIMPGHYAGEAVPPPAHIHVEVRGAGSEGLMTEIVFAGDPSLPPNAGRDGTFVAALTSETDQQGGFWSGVATILLGP